MKFHDLLQLATEAGILDQTPGAVQAPAKMTRRFPVPVGLRERTVCYIDKENSTPGSAFWVPPYKMFELQKQGQYPRSSRGAVLDIPKTVHNREPSARELMLLTKAKWEVKKRVPLLGKILEKMPTVFVDGNSKYQTMAVRSDGIILININFFKAISFDEVVGVLAHEAMHVLFKHLSRLRGRDMMHSNIATDTVINYDLLKAGEFKLPIGGFMPYKSRYGGISSKFGYDALVIRPAPQQILPNQPKLMCYYVELDADAIDTWEKVYDDIMASLREDKRITYCIGEVINVAGKLSIIMDMKEYDDQPTDYTVIPVPPELKETLGL